MKIIDKVLENKGVIKMTLKNKLGLCSYPGCKKRPYITIRYPRSPMGFCKKHFSELSEELEYLEEIENEEKQYD